MKEARPAEQEARELAATIAEVIEGRCWRWPGGGRERLQGGGQPGAQGRGPVLGRGRRSRPVLRKRAIPERKRGMG